MTNDDAACYSAYAARDARFDGVFFIGVTSTGIYCRPVCTARTPAAANCRFFGSAAAAEKASFRPCLRCRPELAPGRALVDGAERVAARVAYRISEGPLDDSTSVERLAAEFCMSARQLRRVVRSELGASPVELLQTRRLLMAKQLLTETSLPITDVAYASGFSSLRRFNDAFLGRYGMPPTQLRRAARTGDGPAADRPLALWLSYRPPYDWAGTLRFMGARAVRGVEIVDDVSYARTVRIDAHAGWLRVHHEPARHGVRVEIAMSLLPVLPMLLARVRQLFDLNARPDVISAHLGAEETLREAVARNPGLRVAGAFDGFELAWRAVLGQQISVKAATTVAGRFADAFGDDVATPIPELRRLTPAASRVAATGVDEIASLGIVGARARSIIAVAAEVASGRLVLAPGADPASTVDQLMALPGIGPWTAHYVAMRALRWPDAFPKEDVVLRQRLGGVTARAAEAMAERWRPWRSYAARHLWEMNN